jgi:hypothetical protein
VSCKMVLVRLGERADSTPEIPSGFRAKEIERMCVNRTIYTESMTGSNSGHLRLITGKLAQAL